MRKRTAVVAAIPLCIAGTVGAFAFISQSLSISGHGATANYQPVTATLSVPGDLAPGDGRDVTLAVHNPNKFSVTFTGLTFHVADIPGCPAGSITIDNPTGSVGAPAGDSNGIKTQIHFNTLPDSQNGCLGALLTVTATST